MMMKMTLIMAMANVKQYNLQGQKLDDDDDNDDDDDDDDDDDIRVTTATDAPVVNNGASDDDNGDYANDIINNSSVNDGYY